MELKITAVIILYNPTIDVLTNIEACKDQVDEVYVIDNSENVNEDLIEKIQSIENVNYQSNNGNKGVANALNIAADRALKNHYDFLLTLDQDSFLHPDTVNEMIKILITEKNVGIISPLHRNKFKTQETHDFPYEGVLSIKTSGNLLNLKIFEKVGMFKEEYFIDYVDIEYGMRLNLLGYKVLRVNNIILDHNEANLSEKKFFGIRVYPWNHKPIRWYYKIRNLLYLENEYKEVYPKYFRKEKMNYLKQFVKILLYEADKFNKIKYAVEGYCAYKKRLTGIRKD